MSKQHVYDLDFDSFSRIFATYHAPQYAVDAWRYLYSEFASDFQEMTTLPLELRNILAMRLSLTQPTSVDRVISGDGNTRKDLLVFDDERGVEVVLLRYRERYSACISTQIGCACGCAFCATGQMGFERSLSTGEIVAQVIYLQRVLDPENHKLSNVVLMGMGEPFLNYDATLSAVRLLVDARGIALAPKRITLSTVGIPSGIYRLAEEKIPIKLALSLHAATDALRDTIMPINRRYPLDTLWDALKYYTQRTGRRIFLEWIMIKGVNDSSRTAQNLVSWVRDLPVHVNLIHLNTSESYAGEPATEDAFAEFTAVLDGYQIPHTVRQRRGAGIQAGCGQLRSRKIIQQASANL